MKRFLKWTGRGLVGLVVLIALALGAAYGVSAARLSETHDVSPAAPAIPTDAAAIARGRHVAATRDCASCHGADFSGRAMIDDPALGRFVAPNLTPAGETARWEAADWDRAVRHGVGADGRPLVVMPSELYHSLSDQDFADLVAFLRSLPPVRRELPGTRVGPLGHALVASGQVALAADKVDHTAGRAAAPSPGPTAAYGEYLAATCGGCHKPDFSGGPMPGHPPGSPPAADLTPAGRLGRWSEAEFIRALRTGVRPDGSRLDGAVMPWEGMTKPMTDDELRALYRYFRQLPAVPTPS